MKPAPSPFLLSKPLDQLNLTRVIHGVAGDAEHQVEPFGLGQRRGAGRRRWRSAATRAACCSDPRWPEPSATRGSPLAESSNQSSPSRTKGSGATPGRLRAHGADAVGMMQRDLGDVVAARRRAPECQRGRDIGERGLRSGPCQAPGP